MAGPTGGVGERLRIRPSTPSNTNHPACLASLGTAGILEDTVPVVRPGCVFKLSLCESAADVHHIQLVLTDPMGKNLQSTAGGIEEPLTVPAIRAVLEMANLRFRSRMSPDPDSPDPGSPLSFRVRDAQIRRGHFDPQPNRRIRLYSCCRFRKSAGGRRCHCVRMHRSWLGLLPEASRRFVGDGAVPSATANRNVIM